MLALDIPTLLKQAMVKQNMVENTLPNLDDDFYDKVKEWLKENNDERMRLIFIKLVRRRLNIILKHIDQKEIPYIPKMTEQERTLFKIIHNLVEEYNTNIVGDLLEEH